MGLHVSVVCQIVHAVTETESAPNRNLALRSVHTVQDGSVLPTLGFGLAVVMNSADCAEIKQNQD